MFKHHVVNFTFYCLFLSLSSLFLYSYMDVLRVGSLNINGGRDRGKLGMVSEFIKIKKVNVSFLQETHTNKDNEIEWGMWWEGKFVLSHGTNNSAGVAILFSSNMNINILNIDKIVEGRLLLTEIEYEETVFVLVNIYAPNNGPERKDLFMKLRDAVQKYDESVCLVIGGDWNCTTDFIVDRNGEEPHSQSAATLLSFIHEFQLIDVWRTRNTGVRQYTWLKVCDDRVSGARLDRFYLNEMWSNRVIDASISPNGFSDHHMITLVLNIKKTQKSNYYWLLNVKFLNDVLFCESFKVFWSNWKLKKSSFESLCQWWDVGKVNIRLFCQNYASQTSTIVKNTVRTLQKDIESMERNLVSSSEAVHCDVLKKKKQELNSYLQEQAKGALIRARFCSVKDMDAPSAFFFNLERKSVHQKQMCHLRRQDGSVTSNPAEMRKLARDFYKQLFSAESCDAASVEDLLEELPQLEHQQKEALDTLISFKELTEAVHQLHTGRSPGIDGLSVDFYQQFWDIIGPDFYEVLLDCIKNKTLPTSCRRAVLSLLPKKGDLGFLKNWRPVSLLCSDYKIFSKCLSNRLKNVLDQLIHKDQSYCIPERSITDNLFLLRDMIDINQFYHGNLGFLSLDQEKAFDRVDHEYLFNVLKCFGFGDSFISYINLLYFNVSVLVKAGGGLSEPILVSRGIRQGCPLSGQLYNLVIEPLLCRLRKNLNGIAIPNSQDNFKLFLSAYADDITVFISNQDDITILNQTLGLYERASSARVNWSKSEGFIVGGWEGTGFPQLPGGLRWRQDGFKALGVFLGNEQFQKKNWEGLLEKVSAKLTKWKWLLPQLSYRGRVLVINNLTASMLWHRTAVMEPPEELILNIQRTLVNFFWSGQHWIRAAALYIPVQEGGQGLVDLRSRIRAFRLQSVQRLLYKDVTWAKTASALLKQAGGLGLDKHLFLMKLEEISLSELPPFYKFMLQTWRTVFKVKRDIDEQEHWTPEEPLFFNPLIQTRLLSSVTVRRCLIRNGVYKLGHLLDERGWKPTEELQELTGLRSLRLVFKLKEEISNALPSGCRSWIARRQTLDMRNNQDFPDIKISPIINEEDGEIADSILSFTTPQLDLFKDASKKALYCTSVKMTHQESLKGIKASKWPELLQPDFLVRDRWRTLYKPPVEKRTADLQWRIIHGAIATDRHVAHLNPAVGGECRFCGIEENLEHLFLKCNRLQGLFNLLEICFRRFNEDFSEVVFIGGLKYSFLMRRKMVLLNYLIGTAKLAIWKTRKNKGLQLSTIDPEMMFRHLVQGRLKLEFAYYKLTNNLVWFCDVWCFNEVLCTVQDDQLVVNF